MPWLLFLTPSPHASTWPQHSGGGAGLTDVEHLLLPNPRQDTCIHLIASNPHSSQGNVQMTVIPISWTGKVGFRSHQQLVQAAVRSSGAGSHQRCPAELPLPNLMAGPPAPSPQPRTLSCLRPQDSAGILPAETGVALALAGYQGSKILWLPALTAILQGLGLSLAQLSPPLCRDRTQAL